VAVGASDLQEPQQQVGVTLAQCVQGYCIGVMQHVSNPTNKQLVHVSHLKPWVCKETEEEVNQQLQFPKLLSPKVALINIPQFLESFWGHFGVIPGSF
jgi:hypothetical protein